MEKARHLHRLWGREDGYARRRTAPTMMHLTLVNVNFSCCIASSPASIEKKNYYLQAASFVAQSRGSTARQVDVR